jgi:hypothetical protein
MDVLGSIFPISTLASAYNLAHSLLFGFNVFLPSLVSAEAAVAVAVVFLADSALEGFCAADCASDVRSIFADGVLESVGFSSRSMEVMEVEDLVLVPLNPGLRWENASVG